ncbi:MAG: caspase family protein [Bacteroidota bacterium]|nr:caspase family protein [Bacteroidota bacterium]
MKLKFLFLLLILAATEMQAQTKKLALIFAIGNYPESGGWSGISSLSDVPYIKAALQKQGFEDINVVQDAAATKAGITKAMEALIAKAQRGDVVVIHFSSHGEQVADNNKDETDGFDETIVSYDAIHPRLSTSFEKDQANYFRDDEFGALISQLRGKLGKDGDVVVFMDACHSGSGTRGAAKVRGGQPPFVPGGFDMSQFQPIDTAGVFKEAPTANTGIDAGVGMATYVVISAARAEELNSETKDDAGKGVGSLTYAISKAFENLDTKTSYRSLFSKILGIMNSKVPKQNPVLEGNGIDRSLFGGQFVPQKSYVEISKLAGKLISVKSGLLSGLDIGAKVEVYPAGTNDPEKAKASLIASGKVTKASNYASDITLDKVPAIKLPADAWVFVTMPVFKISPIVIQVETTKSRGAEKVPVFEESDVLRIKNGLKDMPLASFKGAAELLLVKGDVVDSLKIASNGFVYNTVSQTDISELKDAIQNYAQYKLLQNEIKNPEMKFEVKLVPIINGKADTANIDLKMVNGILEFNQSDSVALWVSNNSSRPIYFNILDMQPDGVINPVAPNAANSIYSRDLKVDRGVSGFILKDYFLTISPPYGMEVFKVFVSFDEINMEMIATTRGANARGNLNSFEGLVKKSFGATRGATGNVKASEGATFNIPFRIVEK